ncbi:alanine--tRNA ligase [Candidatus Dojkabacteria bacterium]|jgi:alanyl-tRNA synthetase|nr:alanine--tRNA ligase [Candidatus Dojkabacteria bacterium]
MKKFGYLEIRKKYIDYFVAHGHKEIASASLVPENDPSVLFTNAGMFPLVPFLLGEQHPSGTKLVNSQRCVRTGDIDEVGDASHCTSFEMLGNWSLNEYFKKEAINLTIDFLIDELGFDINGIYASVFEGNETSPKDTVSIEAWKELFSKHGIKAKVGKGERIQEFPKSKNWWELEAGGPCGPCSEIFFDTKKEACKEDCNINCDCGKFLELGNNVFMEYLKKDGKYSPLGKHNVDFGGGIERFSTICQGVSSFYEIDIYKPIFNKVKELSKTENLKSQRIVTDHIKAATWIIADGVVPSPNERGFVLRKLIRRSIDQAIELGIDFKFTRMVAEVAITQFAPVFPELETQRGNILNIIEEEEVKYCEGLGKVLKNFGSSERGMYIIGKAPTQPIIAGVTFDIGKDGQFHNAYGATFTLYETHGFPVKRTLEELKKINIDFDEKEILENHDKAFKAHQEKSRTLSKGMFKGGLADTSEMSKKYHTLNHLLLAALYNVLGSHVHQSGSNITPERLRLDFPNDTKLTTEQLKQVEDLVNEQIEKGLPVNYKEMSKTEALKIVKYASFIEKYPDMVKVYTIGDEKNPFSVEICGGPHVENTKELGHFKIIKEEAVSAGIRRIKGILE